jgi:LPXTG-motif cell wall-anchored protein
MFGGESTPFTSDTPFQLVSYGEIAPSASVIVVPHITLLEELEVGFYMQCSTLQDPEEAESPTVPSYIDFGLLGAVYDGGAIAPSCEPLPNQAPIIVPGLGTVAINEQVKTVVDGWEILTGTALHIVTPTEDIRLGVVECAQPAVLAATGADRADAQLGVAGAVMLALAGIVLVLGRRRRTA